MDKTIRRIKLSTEKDENGSFYSIIFENNTAIIRFHDGRNGTQRYIHQSYPVGPEDIAMLFDKIIDFEKRDAYFADENFNIIAYDKLIEENALTVMELGLQDDYHIDKLINGIKTALGVSAVIGLDTAALLAQFPEVANLDGSESLRSVLDDVAEITQTIYFIDINNNLLFKQLDKDGAAVLEIAKSDYFDLASKSSVTLATAHFYNFILCCMYLSKILISSTSFATSLTSKLL